MGSAGASGVVRGTFTVPIDDGQQSDPATRPYFAPPKPNKTIEMSFPLSSFREDVFGSNDDAENLMNAEALLREKGFAAVRHSSVLFHDPAGLAIFKDIKAMDNIYYGEIRDIVKHLTGCRQVFVTNGALRGPRAGDPSSRPVGQVDREITLSQLHTGDLDRVRPSHVSHPLQPIRIPHNDYTPLGARSAVRGWMRHISEAVDEAGITAVEEELFSRHDVSPVEKRSQDFESLYNSSGPGPRYAAYSVWRPLKKVTRDPLAMSPRRSFRNSSNLVLWPYENRIPGYNGDWVRHLEQIRIREEAVPADLGSDDKLEADLPVFFYLPDQQTDEVLIVKLFDSIALGTDEEQATGSMHGSPDLGDAAYGDPRESIEVRVFAIW